ncbi:unnamed protein product [Enterobius vermicularis]|uniref:Transmembrane protein n=1 Tax=Enterobius vermicularis TaxID=51028 RepID=A0A0N4VB73_ENTVE|nr:unnamed protein product [Enterobius vermicularis]
MHMCVLLRYPCRLLLRQVLDDMWGISTKSALKSLTKKDVEKCAQSRSVIIVGGWNSEEVQCRPLVKDKKPLKRYQTNFIGGEFRKFIVAKFVALRVNHIFKAGYFTKSTYVRISVEPAFVPPHRYEAAFIICVTPSFLLIVQTVALSLSIYSHFLVNYKLFSKAYWRFTEAS